MDRDVLTEAEYECFRDGPPTWMDRLTAMIRDNDYSGGNWSGIDKSDADSDNPEGQLHAADLLN